MEPVVKTSTKTRSISHKKDKKEAAQKQPFSLKHSIIVTAIIVLILGYIAFDYFYVKQKIESKIVLIDNKFDSLNVYVNNRIPAIDKTLEKQANQVKELQEVAGID